MALQTTGTGYVKFVRGTPAAFAALTTKDSDTLYFISDTDSSAGALYLGSKLVSNSSLDLDDLSDIVADTVADKDLLVYDSDTGKWEATSLDELISTMGGASATAAGTAGLVPIPQAGAQNKFLRGDGIWATIAAADLSPVDNKSITNDGQLALIGFATATANFIPQKSSSGDLTWVSPDSLKTDLTEVNASILELQTTLNNIPNNYLSLTTYTAEVGNLSELLITQTDGNTVVDQMNDLTSRLTWNEVIE